MNSILLSWVYDWVAHKCSLLAANARHHRRAPPKKKEEASAYSRVRCMPWLAEEIWISPAFQQAPPNLVAQLCTNVGRALNPSGVTNSLVALWPFWDPDGVEQTWSASSISWESTYCGTTTQAARWSFLIRIAGRLWTKPTLAESPLGNIPIFDIKPQLLWLLSLAIVWMGRIWK